MNKIFIGFLACGIALSATAQSKLDLHSRAILRNERVQLQKGGLHTSSITPTHIVANGYVSGMIKLADGTTSEELKAEGVNVHKTRGNIALVTMPINDVERISALKCVKSIQLSRRHSLKMDKARTAIGVDKIHAGNDLPQAYTGKGVITGLVDNGVDPNHINFKDADGNSRIGHFTHIYINQAQTGFNIATYPTDILPEFTTDDSTTFHGTHTLGIMSGGFKGVSTVAERKSAFQAVVEEKTNPFYGIAYDAELAVSCPDLMDMLIAYGIEGILDHSFNSGKPAVINLSLGSNIGSHDGKSVMGQYLDLAGKEAIICVSAGNEGDLPIALNQTFTAEDKELKTFIAPHTSVSGYNNLRYGQVYIYSNDTTEFVVKAVIWNKTRGTVTFEIPIGTNSNGNPIYYASPGYAAEGDLTSTNFNRAFEGYLGIGSMIDEDSNRYYAMIDYFTVDNYQYNSTGNYILGFIVTGKEGQRIDCFCDGSFTCFNNYAQNDWDNGSCNGSISDMACANNIIVVGSYNTRDEWASIDGKNYGYGGTFVEGAVSPFSSYGTLIDGRNLPHICAPGATIISSSSSAYIDYYNATNADIQAKYIEEGRTNYWHQAIGTSMACPVVSGAIALWLEADPTLTVDEAKEIIASTAIVDSDVTNSVQWGAGKFDAYTGLKEVIRRAGIDKVSVEDKKLMVTTSDNNLFNIFIGNVNEINAIIYNIAGQPVLHSTAQSDELNIDASGLTPGIYILNVNGQHSQRIIVK